LAKRAIVLGIEGAIGPAVAEYIMRARVALMFNPDTTRWKKSDS
jgi:hypothetical protein